MLTTARLRSTVRSLQYAQAHASGAEEQSSISKAITTVRETADTYGDLMDAISKGYVSASYDLLDRLLELNRPAEQVA